MKVDLFFSEDEIFLTGEKQHQFEIFLRTELGEIINFPESGWDASMLFEGQKKARRRQFLEIVLAYARPQELDFTGTLTMEKSADGRIILKGEDVIFLRQEVVGGNGVKNMSINQDGVYIPDDLETIRNIIENNQGIMGTKFHIFNDTVYQAMANPIITAIYNYQLELAELPALVSNELSMQSVYIERSQAITTDAIVAKAKESEFVDYAEIFNTSSPLVARIELYIYKEAIDFTTIDLQFTANEIALITATFIPYFLDATVTTSLSYTCPVSSISTIQVIFNVAKAVPITVAIVTTPTIGDSGTQLKLDFTELFKAKQGIGVSFDEAFYQRTLFIDGLSSMNYTADITACANNEILTLGNVTVNGA